jgi:hypothetical protein
MANDRTTTNKGPGLARGPALIVGSILLAFGLIAMIKHSAFPAFGANFPDGDATGTKFLGFEVNGWTNWLACVTGGLLLFGAAQHLLAKLMSLIVGIVLGAAAIIALVSGDILGLGAANIITVIGLGAAAVVLVLNLFAPRLNRDDDHDEARRRQAARRDEPRDSNGSSPRDTERVGSYRAGSGRRGGSVAADDV